MANQKNKFLTGLVLKNKILLFFMVAVFVVAINYLVFTFLFLDRQSASAASVLGNDVVGTINYPDAAIKKIDEKKLQIFDPMAEVSVVDNVNHFEYLAGNTYLIQENPSLFKFGPVIIKEDLNGISPIRITALRLSGYDSAYGSFYSAVIDEANGYAYFMLRANATTSRILKVDINPANTFQVVDTLDLPDQLANNSAIFDPKPGRNSIYIGTTNSILRLDTATFTIVGTLDVTLSDRNDLQAGVLDKINDFAYFEANKSSTVRYGIIKIDINPASPTFFQVIDAIDFLPDENYASRAAVIDEVAGYAYFATNGRYSTNPSGKEKIIKINIAPGLGGFSYHSSIELPVTEISVRAAAIDPVNHFAYFGTSVLGTGYVVKINLNDLSVPEGFSRVAALNGIGQVHTVHIDGSYLYFSSGEPIHYFAKVDLATFPAAISHYELMVDLGGTVHAGVWDQANNLSYWGTDNIPGKVFKLELDPFKLNDELILADGEDHIGNGIIDPVNKYAYFGTQDIFGTSGKIVKVNVDPLAVFKEEASLNLFPNPNGAAGAAFDSINNYGYFGFNGGPSFFHQINLNPAFSYVSSISLGGPTNNTWGIGLDLANNYAYYTILDSGLAAVNKVYRADINPLNLFVNLDSADLTTGVPISTGIYDPINQLYYNATANTPGEIQVVDTNPGHVFQRIGGLILPSGGGIRSSVYDQVNRIGYFISNFSPAEIYKIDLNAAPLNYLGRYSGLAGDQGSLASIIDENNNLIYVGTNTTPGKDIKYHYSHRGYINAYKKTVTSPIAAIDYFEIYSHQGTGNLRLALYDGTKNLVWQSNSVANIVTNGWVRVDVSNGTPNTLLNLPAGDYWLAWQTDSSADIASYISGSTGDGFYLAQSYGAFPDPISGETLTDQQWSLYGSVNPPPAICPNTICEMGENESSCPDDCTVCGNAICGIYENSNTCPQDCGALQQGGTQPTINIVAPANLSCEAQTANSIRWSFENTATNFATFGLYAPDSSNLIIKITEGNNLTISNKNYLDENNLLPNNLYADRFVRAINGTSESADSVKASCYTLAQIPIEPKIIEKLSSSVVLALDANDGNPANTEYAIRENESMQYVQPDGTLADTAAWQTYEAWGGAEGIEVVGTLNNIASEGDYQISLDMSNGYSFSAKARNGNGIETAFSGAASTTGTGPDMSLTLGIGINVGTQATNLSLARGVLAADNNLTTAGKIAEQISFLLNIVLAILIIMLLLSLIAGIKHLDTKGSLVKKLKLGLKMLYQEPAKLFKLHGSKDKRGIYQNSYQRYRAMHQTSKRTSQGVLAVLAVKVIILAVLIIGVNQFDNKLSAQSYPYNQDGKVVNVGDVLSYKIEYVNNGSQAGTGAVISDDIPGDLAYVGGSAVLKKNGSGETTSGVSQSGSTLSFDFGDVAPGETGYAVFKGIVKAGTEGNTIINIAQVKGTNFSLKASNTTSNEVSGVVPSPTPTSSPTATPTATPTASPTALPSPTPTGTPVVITTPVPGKTPPLAPGLGTTNANSLVKNINDYVFNNPSMESISKNIITPILLAIALLNTIPTAIALASYLLTYLHLLFIEPLLYLFKKKREKWGVVYDALSKKPVDLAVVRLYQADTKALVQTKVTDMQGRYILQAKEPGKYYITVAKPGYSCPTKYLSADKQDVKYLDLYHGEIIEVTDKEAVITANIPLDPKGKGDISIKDAVRTYSIKNLRLAISYTGIIMAALVVIIYPSTITVAALILHLLLFAIFRRLIVPKRPKSWGIVYDEKDKAGLGQAVVRIFDIRFNKLLEVQVTDRKGRYAFLVGANQYKLLTEKPGYEQKQITPVDLIKKDTIVNLDIGLKKT